MFSLDLHLIVIVTFSYGRHAIRPFVVTTLWQTHAYIEVLKKKPLGLYGGHDWDWTSDPYDVNVVLSRWANAPLLMQIYASRKN